MLQTVAGIRELKSCVICSNFKVEDHGDTMKCMLTDTLIYTASPAGLRHCANNCDDYTWDGKSYDDNIERIIGKREEKDNPTLLWRPD